MLPWLAETSTLSLAPAEWLALIGAALIIGIAKSGFGGGIGILAVPLTANTIPAELAIGVLLPVLIGADVFAVIQHRKHGSRALLVPALVGGAIGVALGSVLLSAMRGSGNLGQQLNLWVGLLCVVMSGLQSYRMLGGQAPRLPGGWIGGGPAGALAGITSTIAHAAGPVMTLYWMERRVAKTAMVGSLVWFFFIVNWLKVPTFVSQGLMTSSTLGVSLGMLAAVPIGAVIGVWMHKRVPEKPFTLIMIAGAVLAGGRMVIKGWPG